MVRVALGGQAAGGGARTRLSALGVAHAERKFVRRRSQVGGGEGKGGQMLAGRR